MVKFCTNCGTQLDDDASFCTNCGTKSNDYEEVNSNSGNFRSKIFNREKTISGKVDNIFSKVKEKSDNHEAKLRKTGRERAKIPHFGGIDEIRDDCLVIKKTGEIIPIKDIKNFSLHQSSQSLWSDVKVDFDYNGLHYRTQQAGTDKGKLQTVEKKLNAIEMSKFTNNITPNTNSNNSEGSKSKAEKIREIKELLDEGIIDEEEFKELKAEIIKE